VPGPTLLDRRLVIVTGKGGVGKSTVSAALALLAARAGKRVLVCEVNAQERVAPLLGAAPTGSALREAVPGISTVNVNPHDSMREYGLMVVRFRAIYDAVFENRLVRYFLRVVPSLAELVMLGKILHEALEVSRGRFAARSVKLILPAKVPDLTVMCREVQIEQVLLNLLQNGFDAVVDQKGERWVRVDVSTLDGSAIISVTDSGPGIPVELRDHIGQPFFTTKEVGKGTGLGLSLSKTIAEEHGGRVEYDEERGHTRFSLVLPLARQAEAA